MRRHSLRTAIILVILPIVIISVVTLSLLGYTTARKTILESTDQEMSLALGRAIENIEKSLMNNGKVAETMARAVEVNRLAMGRGDYRALLTSFIETNDETFGGGIWFEPYAFSAKQKDFSPYAMRENGKVVYADDYTVEGGYTNQEWYTSATNTTESIVWSAPYYDEYTGISMVTSTAPFYEPDGKLLGVTTTDIDLTEMQRMVESLRVRNTGRIFLLDGTGTYIADEDSEKLLKANILQDSNPSLAQLGQEIISKRVGKGSFMDGGEQFQVWYDVVPESGWAVVAIIAEHDLLSGVSALGRVLIVVALFTAAILSVILVVFITRKVTNPLSKLEKATAAIAAGDLNVNIDYRSGDEIGMVFRSMEQTAARLKDYGAYIDEVAVVLGQIADGDLNFRLRQEYSGEFAHIKTALLSIKANLVDTISEIVRSSDRVSIGAREISEVTHSLSAGSMAQSASVEEISSSVNEMRGLMQKSSESLSEARNQSGRTSETLMEDNERMREMAAAMEEIASTSGEIGKIIKTVEDIAFQTNILALNAAVEAARAGTAGKGFSVVADEVRNLANKSSQASKNTAALIERSLQAVERGRRISAATAEARRQVVDDVGQTAGIIRQVADHAIEEVRFASSVTEAVEQVAGVVSSNSAMSEETAAKCAELFEEAKLLQRMASRFRTGGVQEN